MQNCRKKFSPQFQQVLHTQLIKMDLIIRLELCFKYLNLLIHAKVQFKTKLSMAGLIFELQPWTLRLRMVTKQAL